MTNTKDNPSKGIFVSPWTYEDVDLCITDTSVTLTDNQKDECLQDLIDFLSESVGMEYLREIVANKIESCKEEYQITIELKNPGVSQPPRMQKIAGDIAILFSDWGTPKAVLVECGEEEEVSFKGTALVGEPYYKEGLREHKIGSGTLNIKWGALNISVKVPEVWI